MALRTGLAILTVLVKHICRLLTTYRPAMDTVIAAAVASNVITSAQSATLADWLNKAQAACDILRLVTGY